MLSNKAFCIRPWTSACVRTNGDITLCCHSAEQSEHNLKTSTINNWWTSEFVANIRSKMLANEIPNECAVCATLESQGSQSLRQQTNSDYKIFEQYADKMLDYYNYPTPQPVEIELQLTNLCNLKCLMCAETESSSIYTENKILKIHQTKNTDYNVTQEEITQIEEWIKTQPRLINLRGGEPLVVPEIKRLLKWAIDSKLLNNTQVHITTNATKLDSEWLDILTAIPNLRVMVSIDAVGKLNDYIRFGSNWTSIEANVKAISKISNITLVIHASVQNLNILEIDRLIEWCHQNNYYLDYQLVTYPKMFSVTNLPTELINRAKTKLNAVDDKVAGKLISNLDHPQIDLWTELQTEINLRDTIRKTSIVDIIPEFKEHWNAKTN
jgi:molybdenum cofactor biosynthesis enzyme MoaA